MAKTVWVKSDFNSAVDVNYIKIQNRKWTLTLNFSRMFDLTYTIQKIQSVMWLGKKSDFKEIMLPQWDVDETILRLQICPQFYGKNVFANHENRAI